ncbi:hypothetical protein FHT87_002187 [Rhizobium sp. BK316]|uniref:hypothetical protein n=1 Tax=Rhizobium sp. BK316 TaxID=2587053 RepID=UPI00160F6646|nr:hypothetical protein [Rhizobium sp. BK316]MBB3408284.1 hypothetical protein [Rhizobium sp. BK316]
MNNGCRVFLPALPSALTSRIDLQRRWTPPGLGLYPIELHCIYYEQPSSRILPLIGSLEE